MPPILPVCQAANTANTQRFLLYELLQFLSSWWAVNKSYTTAAPFNPQLSFQALRIQPYPGLHCTQQKTFLVEKGVFKHE